MNIDAFNFIANYTYRYDVRDVLVSRIKQKSEDKRDPALPVIRLDQELKQLSDETKTVFDSFPSPIGWSRDTISRQFQIPGFQMPDSQTYYEPIKSPLLLFVQKPLISGSIFVGWIISAGAISMGGPFWLDLFSKFVNIKR